VPIDDRWEKFAPSDWTAFADAGFAELREPASKGESDVGMSVVMMNFTSTSEQQWSFRRWSHHMAGADALIEQYPKFYEAAKKQIETRTANFLETHDS
jgi:hypothetical protein